MKTSDLPFNVELMRLDKNRLVGMRPVTSLDYFENVSGDLHDDGLFSVSIFGRIGDEMRDRRFSYIDLKAQILHPVIYHRLIQLRGLYRGILAGSQYALWDDGVKDFKPASDLHGQTGYAFFLQHWSELTFSRNKSDIRDQRVALIEKYRDRAVIDKILVLPAGLRDIEVGDNGRMVVDEINTHYRRILGITKTIAVTEINNSMSHNLPRHLLQMAYNEIYDAIEKMLTGKKGFLQAKWGSRRIFNGTRNVITAMDTSTAYLGGENAQRYTDTVVGLHQTTKGLLPVTLHHLRNRYLPAIFAPGNEKANLVNPITLKSEQVQLTEDSYDRWTTIEGLEKVISSYGEIGLRNKPILLDGRYLALIYIGPANPVEGQRDPRKAFKIFGSIDELPEGWDPKLVRPINLIELLYLSGYQVWNNYGAFVTRYPVTGVGSCFPCTVYCKTTIVGEMRHELDVNWSMDNSPGLALEFPTYEPLAYLDSHVIQSSRLAGLGADQVPPLTESGSIQPVMAVL